MSFRLAARVRREMVLCAILFAVMDTLETDPFAGKIAQMDSRIQAQIA